MTGLTAWTPFYLAALARNRAHRRWPRSAASQVRGGWSGGVSSYCGKLGFLATAVLKYPNTTPIPAPRPEKAIVAHPAPTSFAAVSCI